MARSTVAVRFTGDVASLKRSIDQVEGRLSGMGGKLKTLGKFAAVGAGATVVAIGAIGKSALESLGRIERIGAQTDAVIRSTGGAAGVTRKQIDDLAGSLEAMSSVEAEAITEGQNLLLTFTKVQNKAGAGNDVFDQATKAMLDMSVAMGKDMPSTAQLVGKALNDPIAGLTALSRAGVQFTDDQKNMIRGMVESGDVMGAQKIILGELNTQFGGSAEALGNTLTGRIERLKHQFGTLTESIAAKLLPVAEKLIVWASENMPGAMARAEAIFGRVGAVVAQVAAVVQQHWPQIQATIISAVTGVRSAVTPIVGALQALWDNFGNNILSFVQRVWPAIQQVIEGALAVIQGVITTVTALIRGDWARVWEGIKQIVWGVWNAIQGVIRTALEGVRLIVGAALEVIGSAIKSAWNGIVDWFSGLPGRFAEWGHKMWDGVKDAAKSAADWVLEQIDRILGPLKGAIDRFNQLKSGVTVGGDINKWGKVGADLKARAGTPRALGGPVTAGRPYLVGERGPELLVPHGSGTVIPAGDTAAMLSRGGITIGTVVLGQGASVRDLADELTWQWRVAG